MNLFFFCKFNEPKASVFNDQLTNYYLLSLYHGSIQSRGILFQRAWIRRVYMNSYSIGQSDSTVEYGEFVC